MFSFHLKIRCENCLGSKLNEQTRHTILFEEIVRQRRKKIGEYCVLFFNFFHFILRFVCCLCFVSRVRFYSFFFLFSHFVELFRIFVSYIALPAFCDLFFRSFFVCGTHRYKFLLMLGVKLHGIYRFSLEQKYHKHN